MCLKCLTVLTTKNKMKILVFGKNGQVASSLAGLSDGLIFHDRHSADFNNPQSCIELVEAFDGDVIVNAASYTNVEQAESEEELASIINSSTPGAIARCAAGKSIPFIHISTDYVFNGKGEAPWQPDDSVNPINAYGRSKLAGERLIQESGCQYVILRTSSVFSSYGNNFVKTMLRLAQTHPSLRIVEDQTSGPTAAADIAQALLTIAASIDDGKFQSGIHHFCGTPYVSWAEFALEIFKQTGKSTKVEGIPSSEYPSALTRPMNSRLDCTSLEQAFGIKRPDWRESLRKVLNEL